MPETRLAPSLMDEVRTGLLSNPKHLPPTLFYDSAGSALFELITGLAEYYPTRTERGILEHHATGMLREAGQELEVVELGAGSAAKTHLLLKALLDRQASAIYAPIDVSESALEQAKSTLAVAFPQLEVRSIHADYQAGLASLEPTKARRLVLFLGSTIGNFDPDHATEFLRSVRESLRPGDALLIGMDQVKSPTVLVPAYDDALGITAQFNLNVLVRLNGEWGADFQVGAFRHMALWNEIDSRIEMHLESQIRQAVRIAALDLEIHLQKGERIHTENSYKYRRGMGEAILQNAGWKLERTWMDEKRWFALHLARF